MVDIKYELSRRYGLYQDLKTGSFILPIKIHVTLPGRWLGKEDPCDIVRFADRLNSALTDVAWQIMTEEAKRSLFFILP